MKDEFIIVTSSYRALTVVNFFRACGSLRVHLARHFLAPPIVLMFGQPMVVTNTVFCYIELCRTQDMHPRIR